MRKILIAIVVCVLTVLAACSSAPAYNPVAIKGIMEKVDRGEDFTQEDYSLMIDQLDAIVDELAKDKKKLENMTPETLKADTALTEMMSNYITLSMIVTLGTGDLDDANKAKLKKFQEKAETFDKE